MNIDLITKLAKLANNNPNDNEANSAARKVCRLLADGEFKFNNSNPIPPGNRPEDRNKSWSNHPFDDMFNHFYGREPPRGPTTRKCKSCGKEFSPGWLDIDYNLCNDCSRKKAEEDKVKRQQQKEGDYTYQYWYDEKPKKSYKPCSICHVAYLTQSDSFICHTYRIKQNIERDLTCSICGIVFKIKFVGPSIIYIYICFACQRKK